MSKTEAQINRIKYDVVTIETLLRLSQQVLGEMEKRVVELPSLIKDAPAAEEKK